jgi:hypothetical protein
VQQRVNLVLSHMVVFGDDSLREFYDIKMVAIPQRRQAALSPCQ